MCKVQQQLTKSITDHFFRQTAVREDNMDLRQVLVGGLGQEKRVTLLLGAAGVLLSVGLGWKLLGRREKLQRVGVVSRLFVYPLKSGRAINVSDAQCLHVGLEYRELRDRHWMVVTEDGQMVTGRQEPRLVLVSLTSDGAKGGVCLQGPDMEELWFPIDQPENRILDCRVFGLDIQGRDCGDEASRWLTSFFAAQKTLRLVHFEPQMKGRQPVEEQSEFPQFEVAYPDSGPMMLLSEASVEDLSCRLEKPVTVERFRPNIVVNECEAYDEDSWEELQIGSVRLQRVMSCGRCIFTTVDPETGVISRKEPLETLKSYRLCKPSERHIYKSSPLFGQVHKVQQEGKLQVGDVVYKVSR